MTDSSLVSWYAQMLLRGFRENAAHWDETRFDTTGKRISVQSKNYASQERKSSLSLSINLGGRIENLPNLSIASQRGSRPVEYTAKRARSTLGTRLIVSFERWDTSSYVFGYILSFP
jgi:hypothetical protein